MFRTFVLVAVVSTSAMFAAPASADHGSADEASPNMLHIENVGTPPEFETGPANEGRFNSDLAFWESGAVKGPVDLAAQGNYDGFRLLDISDPENVSQISVVECRSNQGDVSFYQAQNRLLLIQSIDRPVTEDDCATARDTGITFEPHPITGAPTPRFIPGFEGLRIFDVTNPTAPVHIASVPTACGSHTHTTIPDQRNRRAIVYVSSYPIGASITPTQSDFGGPRCQTPHAKFSIVEIRDKAPETARVIKEQPLHADTQPFRGTLSSGGTGAIGCHDITAFYHPQSPPTAAQSFKGHWQVAGGACLSEGQLWDISDPANPTTQTTHSHIRNEVVHNQGLFHTASFSWDGRIVLFTDEFAGGGGSGCKGEEDPKGNVWFYKTVAPGVEPVPLFGRYMFPRVQPPEDACTLHNGNVITVNPQQGYFGVSSAYEAGTSVFDFTGVEEFEPIVAPTIPESEAADVPLVAREIAFFDAKLDCHTPAPEGTPEGDPNPKCVDDAWSSYWHNDFIYVSSGLDRPGKRGFDVYLLLGMNGRLVDEEGNPTVTSVEQQDDPNVQQFRGRKVRYTNPQTQDTFQALGKGQ
ncbi:MAG: hypothetical protein M3N24_01485 [Actinomycetota bacterium]|nr:hypothetical protein [Actinomycetota bacterium]